VPIAPALVYLANYSGVPVFEMTVRGIAVMRRRSDGFLNATQILKVAGIEKGRRTKILEKEIQHGEHDKVQGGYGKYQGTWIPLSRAQEVAAIHNVSHILKPLLLFDPATESAIPNAAPRRRPNPNAPQQSVGRAAATAAGPASAGSTSTANTTSAAAVLASDTSQGGPEGHRVTVPTHKPRFLALSKPAPTALGGDFLNQPDSDLDITSVQGAPSSSQVLQKEQTPSAAAAIGEDVFGPLTKTAAAASKTLGGSTAVKRSTPTSGPADGALGADGEPAAKRARPAGPDSAAGGPATSQSGLLLGPSPVKDLNALHPSAGLLQAASHPGQGSMAPGAGPHKAANAAVAQAHVRASAWNAAAAAAVGTGAPSASPLLALGSSPSITGAVGRYALRSSPRYADRPRLPRASDEGERKARELLIQLFIDEPPSGPGATIAGENRPAPSSNVLGGFSLANLQQDGTAAASASVGEGKTDGAARDPAVKTPAEIAAAARAPFVFGAAAVGAARANASLGGGAASSGGVPGRSDGVLPPEVAQRKLDELLSLLVRAVGLNGFEETINSAAAAASVPPSALGAARRRGIDLDIVTDDHGHTVLHWAAALGNIELVSVLTARPPVASAAQSGAASGGAGPTSATTPGGAEKGKQREHLSAGLVQGVSLGGANPNAGNHAGETALQRTVLVVNAWEYGYFPHLLRLLAPSLMTRDFRGRTVLHHIALVSGLRGRGASARYYLECILEFARDVYGPRAEFAGYAPVAENGSGGGAVDDGAGARSGPIGLGLGLGAADARRPAASTSAGAAAGASSAAGAQPASTQSGPFLPRYVLENLVDAQDEDGETALGIVARLGNAGLVKLLLDAGARKDLPNLLGIRPSDWGLEMVGLGVNGSAGAAADTSMESGGGDADATRVAVGNELAATWPHDIMAALGSQVKRTPMKSSDILESISHSLDELNAVYNAELVEKNSALEAVQGLLKQATRDLANERRHVSEAQTRADAREETLHRLNNLLSVLVSLKVPAEEDEDVRKRWLAKVPGLDENGAVEGSDGDVFMDDNSATANSAISLLPIPLLEEIDLNLSKSGGGDARRSCLKEAIVRTDFVLKLMQRENDTLTHAINEVDGAQSAKEAQYRRLVSICSGVPERNVVEMLDELVLAIESDGVDVDLDRLAGFLDKIHPHARMSRGTSVAAAGPGLALHQAGATHPSVGAGMNGQ